MKAFSLANAPHLPVTGESHPLVKESVRWLSTGNAIVVVSATVLCLGLYARSQMQPDEPPVVEMPGVVDFDDFRAPPPPPIVQATPPDASAKPPVTPPELAFPQPVDDRDAPDDDFTSIEDWKKFWDDRGDYDGPVDIPSEAFEPAELDTFVPFDDLPELVSIGEPAYPALAQEAGIDGTVMVKVLVTRTGKVKSALAVEGPEALWNSAVNAAKSAVFTPAMQGDEPVEVWVTIPVTFSLNR